jgi:hypothetical protein
MKITLFGALAFLAIVVVVVVIATHWPSPPEDNNDKEGQP